MHVAIIMDGNGRWAEQKGLKRTKGHEEGAKVARNITAAANEFGIKYITLYAFSTENWKRPKIEVEFLMKLLGKYLDDERETYLKNNIKFKVIGDKSKLTKKLQKKIENLEQDTKNLTGVTQVLAVNYGSQDEIFRAVKSLGAQINDIQDIENALDTKDIPPVDILIRTGGEKRLSNFLLWQAAYAELFFTDTFWPDFNKDEFLNIILEFQKRNRRFGGL